MSEDMAVDDYEFAFQFEGSRVECGVHSQNAIHEPRIRWRAEDGEVAGKWASIKVPEDRTMTGHTPYMTMEVAEPELRFGRYGNSHPTIEDTPRDKLTLPNQLASDLREALVQLGTVTNNNEICTDSSLFPAIIEDPGLPSQPAEWERLGWEAEKNIMWYTLRDRPHPGSGSVEWEQEAVTSPRPYQIDAADDLIWRKQHFPSVQGSTQDQDLIEKLELERMG